MAVYLQSTSEENLSTCISKGLWGNTENRLRSWKPGDQMIAYVDRALAALFTITGSPFYDENPIWSDKLYPYRVPIQPVKLIRPTDRESISNPEIREVLFRYHTSGHGTALVLNAKPLHPNASQFLLDIVRIAPEWDGIDSDDSSTRTEVQAGESSDDRKNIHYRMQYYLAVLGSAFNFDIWLPRSDRARVTSNGSIETIIDAFPNSLSVDDQTLETISNIDVIWLERQYPSHLFEIEHTTNIQTGLVRMNDLLRSIPRFKISMYICASNDRHDLVRKQVARPTFNTGNLNLRSHCQFISFERLEEFVDSNWDLLMDMKPSVVDRHLAVPLD